MLAVVFASVWLAAAPPAPARADALAAKGEAEALFLEFGAVKPEDYDPADRPKLAKALAKGAEAARKDPMIAVGLAEKAAQLDRTPATLTLLSQIEVDLGQRAAAAEHLDEALALKADHLPALLARAELAMKEEDFAVAVKVYEQAQAAGAKNLKAPLAKARAAAGAKERAVADLKRTESEIKTRVADAAKNATRDWLKQIVADDDERDKKHHLAPDGVRRQEMANFVFSYSTGSKKTGDMFAFEGKVEKLLEKTYDFVSDRLGYKLPGKTSVVLMSREEYMGKYGATPMARASGFWDGHEIVVNGGAEVNESFAQVMVHEFTHAVVTDLAGHGNPPRWMNEGLAENMRLCAVGLNGKVEDRSRAMLAGLKKENRLPRLGDLEGAFAGMVQGVEVAYAMAAVAAGVLVDKHGYTEYLDALREMKRNRPTQVIEKHYMSLDEVEKALNDAI